MSKKKNAKSTKVVADLKKLKKKLKKPATVKISEFNSGKKSKRSAKTSKHLKQSYCTDMGAALDKAVPQLRRIYQEMSAGKFTAHAIAQFIDAAEFTVDFESAIFHTFHVPPKTLTKKEIKVARYAYKIAESNYLCRLHKLVLVDDKAHSSLKVIAEIKQLIKQPDKTDVPNAGLHVTFTDKATAPKKAKKMQKKYAQQETVQETYEPLALDDGQTANIKTEEVTH